MQANFYKMSGLVQNQSFSPKQNETDFKVKWLRIVLGP